MAIALSTNFLLGSQLPLDARTVVANTTARDAIPAIQRYNGLIVYTVTGTKNYQLQGGILNANWVDMSLGAGSSQWTTDTYGITYASNVGVGAASNSGAKLYTTPANDVWGILLQSSGVASHSLGMLIDAGTNGSDVAFCVRSQGGTYDYFSVKGDGKVGIGTTTPAYPLDIVGRSRVRGSVISGGGFWMSRAATPTIDDSFMGRSDDSENHMGFYRGGWRLTIEDTTGYVGVGIPNAWAPFHIVKGAGVTAPTTILGGRYLQIGGTECNTAAIQGIGFGYITSPTNESPAFIGYQEVSTIGFTYGDLLLCTRSTTGISDTPSVRMRVQYDGNINMGGLDQATATAAMFGTHGFIIYDAISSGIALATGTRRYLTWLDPSGRLAWYNGSDRMILDISGNLTATNFILSSDRKLKTNIQLLDSSRPVTTPYVEFELLTDLGQKRVGVIAQDLEVEHPEFVRTDDKGIKSVAYIDLHSKEISDLKFQLKTMMERIMELERKLL
jgi:hypothetical protein